MKENKLKILWIALFVLFAMVSCWATANSLHLLLPFKGFMNWFVSYVIAIGFMTVAAIGSKLIVDSLNMDLYQEGNRTKRLIGGIVLMIFFWLICSMPTNTHTFFYESEIEEVLFNDLAKTDGYLTQLYNNSVEKERFVTWETLVEGAKNNVQSEITNPSNKGWGPVTIQRMNELNDVLITPQTNNCDGGQQYTYGSTIAIPSKMSVEQGFKHVTDQVQTQIARAKRDVEGDEESGVAPTIPTKASEFVPVADEKKQYIKWYETLIDSAKIEKSVTPEMIEEADVKLYDAYNCINKYACYVNFDPQSDEELYHPESGKIKTQTSRMKSVYDVWIDYLRGRYKGMGFSYLILLSILLDLAAFLFFDMAFKEEY